MNDLRLLAALVLGTFALLVLTESSAARGVHHQAACTIVGTPGADRLVGTSGRDVIAGSAAETSSVAVRATTS